MLYSYHQNKEYNMTIFRHNRVVQLNKPADIIPQKYTHNNTKRIEEYSKTIEGTTDMRTATLRISEEVSLDTQGFYRAKDQAMVNLFIAMVPKGITRSITLMALYSSNRKNIIFDTTKLEQAYPKVIAVQESISESSVYKIIEKLVKLNWIRKLNKYQYMVNPYYSVRNDLSATRIAQLQLFWDRWDNGYKQTEPIIWRDEESIGNSHETIEDLKALHDNVIKADNEFNVQQALKKQHIADDIATILANPEPFGLLAIKFFTKHDYSIDSVITKDLAHFARYIRKGQKESWPEFDDLPTLHLDRTIKPLRELFKD